MNGMIPYQYRRKNQNGEGPNHLVPVENVLNCLLSQFKLHLQLVCAPRLPPSAIKPEQGKRADGNPGVDEAVRDLRVM